ncbi:MAG: PKD domain-containing protein, partial [Bacteroidetes bacterium]|nr:PKD domain-containing protein [Bacteroidota bacterium]
MKKLYFSLIASILISTFASSQTTVYEGFENNYPPAGWTTSGSFPNYLFRTTSGTNPAQSPAAGSYELEWQSYNATNGASEDLITSKFDLSGRGSNTPYIGFYFYRDVTAYDNSSYDGEGVNVYVNANSSLTGATYLGFVPRRGGQAAGGPNFYSGTTTTGVSGWFQYFFTVPSAFSSCSNYIIFDFQSKFGNNCFMDYVQYDTYPSGPVLSFSINPDTTCMGKPVTFTNTSTNNCSVDHYIYYFGDGGSTTVYNTNPVAHTYTYQNTFSPSMTAYDINSNSMGSYYSPTTVYVRQGSSGNFMMSKDTICPGEVVNFDPQGNPSPFTWKFSDGYTTTQWMFQRTISTLGSDTVRLVFNTPCGKDSITRILHVLNTIQPNSNFTSYPDSACKNVNVSFNPVEYTGTHSWNFGDGKTSTLQNPTHSYTATGTYTVTHTLTNLCNNTTSFSKVVKIVSSIFPSVDFGFNPNTPVCPGIQFSFNSWNYDGPTWSWNFGDGNTATGTQPKHTYTVAGTYSVVHTVTNQCGNSTSKTYTLSVDGTQIPNNNFSFYPNPACPGDLIYFYGQEQYGKTFFWKFGDGNTSSIQSPSHKYASPGNYAITYTVTNFCNNSATKTDTIHVKSSNPLTVSNNFNVYPTPACATQPLTFDFGTYGFSKYIFHYGDGIIDTVSNATIMHSYASPGTYTATATAVNNCGNDTTFARVVTISSSIPFPNSINLGVSSSLVCPTENVNFYGPWGYPSYQWNMGDGSPAFNSNNNSINYSYSATGTYTASVKCTNYCGQDSTVFATVIVNNSTSFCNSCSLYTNGGTACPNSSVYLSASSGYAWYHWKFGDGDSLSTSNYNPTHTYTAVGTYNYSVTITNFCGIDTTLFGTVTIDNTIPVPNWLWLNIYPNIVCPNQMVQFNTDNSYASYLWNFGDGVSANGTGNAAHTYTAGGTYNISVVVGNTCGNTATLQGTVTVDTAATFPGWMSMGASDPACPNSPVNLSTLAGYASYQWDFGDGSQTITTSTEQVMHSYTATGSYYASVFVTNSCGKTVTLYKNITINNSQTISWLDIYLPNNPACPGDVVMMNPQIGAGNGLTGITFSWDYGDGSPLDTTIGTGTSHTYTAAGVYNVVLTAQNTCGNSKVTGKLVTINNTSSPQLNPWNFGIMPNNNPTSTVCPGDVLVFYFEGIDPNNLWNFGDGNTGVATDIFVRSDGVTVTTIKHAYANTGSYNYTLTLGNHCNKNTSLTKSLSVTSNLLVSGGFMISPPASVLGYTTCGLINFVAYGGKNFIWDFGDGTILTTLSPTMSHAYVNPGNYTVKVTITNGCGSSATYTQTLIVNGAGGTSVSTASVISPTCHGGSNGSATALVSGGQPPYNYTWYDNLNQIISTNVSAGNLSSGTYTIIVTDNNGCAGNTSVTLNNPAAITFSVSTTKASCGGTNGTASVSSIANGTSPYTYSWSTGQTTASASGFAMGTYAVTILDANGCSSTSAVSISENGAVLSLSSTTSVTCNGGANGAVNINATGGNPPYAFAWSNGATTQNINTLAAGSYSVVVTDNAGCKSSLSATVSQPSAIVVNPTTTQAPTCGNFNGSATANVSGGKSPYTYLWDANTGSKTTQTVTGLFAGTYSVTVTDASGCTNKGVVTLSNANAPVVTSVVTPISCNGMNDGAINLSVTGGTSPYGYTWNVAPPNQPNQTNLGPGFYFVTIQDAAGCNTVKSFTITNPSVLAAALSSSAATCSSNGTATASISGGTTPYTYSWSNGATTANITGLAGGNY